jgi:predicted PurR-regulated permease PerM/methylmalonyl-CoA mutase cobalamin-binding subunit
LRANHPAPALADVANMVERVQKEVSRPSAAAAEQVSPSREPVPVEVESAPEGPWRMGTRILTPVLAPIGTALIVIVFVVAILFQRDDLRDRFLKVVSGSHLNVATQVVADATERVSRYLGMQFVINCAYGVVVGVSLRMVGIPNSLLWGIMAAVFRFIPYIGPWIGAACPILLSIAIDPGWSKVAETFGLYLAAEFFTANVVEVLLYGASTGLSPLAIMISAIFWTWLWGPAGLFLATPITVCLLVLGKHVPTLSYLNVLLGSRPALAPPAQFYHRMLAMDSRGMVAMALKFAGEHPLAEFYDDVFVPALIMSEVDRHRGTLSEMRERFITSAGRELVEELERRGRRQSGPAAGAPEASPQVLIIPAADDADELAARMLRHLLWVDGIGAAVAPVRAAGAEGETIDRAAAKGCSVLCVSALPPSALGPARHVTRWLKEDGAAKVVAGIWAPEGNLAEIKQRLSHAQPDGVATSLTEAAAQIEQLLGRRAGDYLDVAAQDLARATA